MGSQDIRIANELALGQINIKFLLGNVFLILELN